MEILYRRIMKRKEIEKLDKNYESLMELSGQRKNYEPGPEYEIWSQLSALKTLIEMGELYVEWDDEPGKFKIHLHIEV